MLVPTKDLIIKYLDFLVTVSNGRDTTIFFNDITILFFTVSCLADEVFFMYTSIYIQMNGSELKIPYTNQKNPSSNQNLNN